MKKNAQTQARAGSTRIAPPSPCPPGRERLTWPEIQARYPDQWVVLVDIERVAGELHTASVLHAGQRHNETLRASQPLWERDGYTKISHRYTGEPKSPIHLPHQPLALPMKITSFDPSRDLIDLAGRFWAERAEGAAIFSARRSLLSYEKPSPVLVSTIQEPT